MCPHFNNTNGVLKTISLSFQVQWDRKLKIFYKFLISPSNISCKLQILMIGLIYSYLLNLKATGIIGLGTLYSMYPSNPNSDIVHFLEELICMFNTTNNFFCWGAITVKRRRRTVLILEIWIFTKIILIHSIFYSLTFLFQEFIGVLFYAMILQFWHNHYCFSIAWIVNQYL